MPNTMPMLAAALLAAGLAGCTAAQPPAAQRASPAAAAPAPAALPPPQAAQPSAAAEGARQELARLIRSDPNQGCNPQPVIDLQGYEGRPVRRCVRSRGGLTGVTYLLNPSRENMAARIADACAKAGKADSVACGRWLAQQVATAGGGQFPVAGVVIETRAEAGLSGPPDEPLYFEFRHGVTVRSTERLNATGAPVPIERQEAAARAPLVAAMTYARLASATRDDYRRAGGNEAVGRDAGDDAGVRWPVVVRENELRAQDTGVDELMRGMARRPSLRF
ncbi:hypothetical protein [Falsiroseomonas ponticola]|uniref:hypothetical protein n=1 Tax=Falsiroseomonas ponticola TaxID=2786951 RepID=UPI001933C5D1|nr:hypothetical protein [Roseomonas ponticola]